MSKLFYLFELALHLEWMKNTHSLWLLWAWENNIQVHTEMVVFYMYILIRGEVSAESELTSTFIFPTWVPYYVCTIY